jgi:hypothetical protein
MLPWTALADLAKFAGPTCGAALVLTGILWIMTRLFATTSEAREQSQIESITEARESAEYERQQRTRAETRGDRLRGLAFSWHARAHEMRIGRLDDRHAISSGRVLPPVPELPPFEDAPL